MRYRRLGSTGLVISEIAFGAGPIAGLMTEADTAKQAAVVSKAVDCGIDWFDTAATYGAGQSEINLGHALRQAKAMERVRVATKVRLLPEHLGDISGHVNASVHTSLERLGLQRITLLQLHNSTTRNRGDEPTSLTPHDVIGAGGVLDAFRRVRDEGLVEHFGLTAIGQAGPLHEVVASCGFATIQVPYSLANPTAGATVSSEFPEANYGEIINECERLRMGVFAIRIFAGGALLEHPPSPYTFQTKFFPLDLFRRDERRAGKLKQTLKGTGLTVKEAAIRFVLSHSGLSSAIVGFAEPSQIDEAIAIAAAGPLDDLLQRELTQAAVSAM